MSDEITLLDYAIQQGVTGIFVGILTAVLLYVVKAFWVESIAPAIQKLKYEGVIISADWIGSNGTDEEGSKSLLKLKQNAHSLSGDFNFCYTGESNNFSIDFKVTGYIWEGYLTLNFTPKDRRVTSYATAFLKIHKGGATLEGQFVYRNVFKECVENLPLSLRRETP